MCKIFRGCLYEMSWSGWQRRRLNQPPNKLPLIQILPGDNYKALTLNGVRTSSSQELLNGKTMDKTNNKGHSL